MYSLEMTIDHYQENFKAACRKTIEWSLADGLKFTELRPTDLIRELVFEQASILIPQLQKLGFHNSESLAGNCIEVNSILAEHLSSLGVPCVLTIGSMHVDDYVYMPISYSALQSEIESPNLNGALAVHVWLTLEDGTIVDWTGPAWFDQMTGANFPLNECMDVLMQGKFGDSPYKYMPYLVGDGFLKKVGAIRIEPLIRPVQRVQYNIAQVLHQLRSDAK